MQENCAFLKKSAEIFGHVKKKQYLCTRFEKINGAIAQLVEQRTENPCVPGSIPGGTTERNANDLKTRLLAFFLLSWTSKLATFDQHFDTFSPFLMLKKSVFEGYYNTKKEGKITFFSF